MPRYSRVLLGVAMTTALLVGGGHHVVSAAAAQPSTMDFSGDDLVAVSKDGRFHGLVRPETLVRESAHGMTRQTTAIRPRVRPATGNLVELTVRRVDRNGVALTERPDSISLSILSLDDSTIEYGVPAGVIALPPGRYSVMTTIATPRPGREPTYSLIAHPELVLTGDADLTLDARTGQRVLLAADNPDARGGDYSVFISSTISDCACTRGMTMDLNPRFDEVYAATVPGTWSDTFALRHALRAVEPAVELVSTGPEPFEVPALWMDGSPTPAQRLTAGVVHGGTGSAEDLAGLDVRGRLVLLQVPGDTGEEDLLARLAAVAARGGRMAMVTSAAVAPALTTVAERAPAAPVLPTLYGFGATVQRFFDQVRAGASTVSFVSRDTSAVRYELAHGVAGAVTAPVIHRPATTGLAAVPTTYHEAGPDRTAGARGRMSILGSVAGTGWDVPVATPQQRTEYFSPGAWELSFDGLTDTRRFVAGPNPPLAWGKAVAGPAFTGTTVTKEGSRPWAYRDGDTLDLILPMVGDAAGRPRVPDVDTGDTGSISLYRDGTHIGTTGTPDAARFAVPPAAAGYRLSATVTRTAGRWPLSTKVSADWTFRSGPADRGEPLPLLTVRFDPALDPANRAAGGRAFTIPAYAPGARTLTVDVSYDDGTTWRPATVRALNGRFSVTVNHPAQGFASLRARATGTNGRSVDQTILRAYRIGG